MTFPVYNSEINTIEKLANEQSNGRIQVIVIESGSNHQSFMVQSDYNLILILINKLICISGSKNRTEL